MSKKLTLLAESPIRGKKSKNQGIKLLGTMTEKTRLEVKFPTMYFSISQVN